MGTARRNLGNLLVVAGAILSAWITFWDFNVSAWPGHGYGLWRLTFTILYFIIGWQLRVSPRKSAHSDALYLIGAFVLTGLVIADVGASRFDGLPGPDLLDAYVLQGTVFASMWWLRAVTNVDYRRMCGWVVIIGAGLYRLIAWPYVAYASITTAA